MSGARFTLTDAHLKLARRMYVEWDHCETGAPAINPKRPYGNSDVDTDVLEILGWDPEPFDYDRDDYYYREAERDDLSRRAMEIHREMQTAMQIILGHAGEPVEPGDYVNTAGEYFRPVWARDAAKGGE